MDLKNPAGIYESPPGYDSQRLAEEIEEIRNFPQSLEKTISGLSEQQLNTLTLPGNWTVAQVVHHLADSHMNAFIRLKLALTEDNPVIKPYPASLWANLVDGKDAIVQPSLEILRGVHRRMDQVLQTLDATLGARTFVHPEMHRKIPVFEIPALYSWHGRHHLAHIQLLKEDRGW